MQIMTYFNVNKAFHRTRRCVYLYLYLSISIFKYYLCANLYVYWIFCINLLSSSALLQKLGYDKAAEFY